MTPHVVLFDIDGTLLSTDGAGRRAMEYAMTTTYGVPGVDGYRYDGKTDRQIVREQLRALGHDDAWIDDGLERVIARYLERLPLELEATRAAHVVHRGVVALLDALAREPRTIVGLLTGNVEPGARAKLEATGIGRSRFVVGAFGSDHEVRAELPAIAQARAEALLGRPVAGEALVIIGDTPADMTCGAAIGARAIGVTTGRFTHDALAAHAPVAVFDALDDVPAVTAAILGHR
ncbi:MAG: haloacid dehalogenase-like hydrolase [Gemmatimonadaceae bacterium]|jgi:phosphoglycolate phosphatase-like HAD superfamily hydrolase|nr:haloacid dehalogenase-like hydrolase [Gemmatimonadaceae bacterium]